MTAVCPGATMSPGFHKIFLSREKITTKKQNFQFFFQNFQKLQKKVDYELDRSREK